MSAQDKLACSRCSRCCTELQPSLKPVDIARLSKHFGISEPDFIAKYMHRVEDRWQFFNGMHLVDGVLVENPCRFLKRNTCTIYVTRPDECERYDCSRK